MDGVYSLADVNEADEARGFVLVNFYDSRVKHEDWRSFLAADEASDPPGRETVFVQDRRGYIHAVLSIWADRDLVHGRVLRALTIACDETPGKLLHETIITATEARARALGCVGVLIEIAADAGDVFAASARGAGFAQISASFYRALPRV